MKKLFCSLILILAILLAGCAGTTTSAAAPTAAPTHASAPGIVTASVNVVPVDKSNLAFIISGPVKQVDVTEGDQVKAGQPLVEQQFVHLMPGQQRGAVGRKDCAPG